MTGTGNPKIAIIRQFLECIGRLDVEGAGEFLHEDAVMTFPYIDQIPDVVGRQAIIDQIAGTVPKMLKEMNFTYDAWHETTDPDVVIAEYHSKCPLLNGQGFYENDYICVFRFKDGRIALYKEYLNPARMAVYGDQLGS